MSLLDGFCTSPAWNRHPTRTAVLAVGSFEQHSCHLPLASDTLLASYFAEVLARRLDAALLPALPFGTCFEQSGFRGSIGIKPETQMALLRDIGARLEEQNFSLLIVVNMHGGNFSLAPVIREFNRSDRLLKMLLCYPPELVPAIDGDLHAGEWETSLMLALFPDHVGKDRIDLNDERWLNGEFRPTDLNHWGIGAIAPHGAVGFPSRASAETGKRIALDLEAALCCWADKRLAWIAESPSYQGSAGLSLRRLLPSDLESALQLSTAAGWNQVFGDWESFLRLNPLGCFAMIANGRLVGTATTIDYASQLGWIGMVLVDRRYRRQGIGRTLLCRALEQLADCRSIGLDATKEGEPLYQSLGFQAKERVVRFYRSIQTKQAQSPTSSGGVRPMVSRDLEYINEFDAERFGVSRHSLLVDRLKWCPAEAVVAEEKGRIVGYAMARPGRNGDHIGPLVADSFDCARSLLNVQIIRCSTGALLLDTLLLTDSWRKYLLQMGFAESRVFQRMWKGRVGTRGVPKAQFAQSGPELG